MREPGEWAGRPADTGATAPCRSLAIPRRSLLFLVDRCYSSSIAAIPAPRNSSRFRMARMRTWTERLRDFEGTRVVTLCLFVLLSDKRRSMSIYGAGHPLYIIVTTDSEDALPPIRLGVAPGRCAALRVLSDMRRGGVGLRFGFNSSYRPVGRSPSHYETASEVP